MLSLPEKNRHLANGEPPTELNRFRPYLRMLARSQLDETLQPKLDDSDIVQQTLLEAHQSLAQFRGQSDQEKAAWLQQILARNIADEIRKYRRGKRDVRLEASLNASLSESAARLERWVVSQDGTPSECAMFNEQLMTLAASMMRLPEDQRRAIELHHLQGHSSATVAARMQRTEVAIAGLLRRGLKGLREMMRESSRG